MRLDLYDLAPVNRSFPRSSPPPSLTTRPHPSPRRPRPSLPRPPPTLTL